MVFSNSYSVHTLTVVDLELSLQCHRASCWEELCRIGCLKPECADSHTTGHTARMFSVAGSEKLKLISSNKTCQGWVAMVWLIQQFSVIITDPHSFCLSVLLPAVCYSCPHASVHYGWKVALIVPCVQTWQLPEEEEKDCLFPLCHFKHKDTHPSHEALPVEFASHVAISKPVSSKTVGLDQSGPTLQVWGCSHAALTHTHTRAYHLPASGSQLRMADPRRIWAFGKGFMNPHIFEIVNLNKSHTYILVFFTFKQILLWLVNKTHLNITAKLTVFYFVLSQSVLYFLWAGQSGEATQERLRRKQKYYTHRYWRQEARLLTQGHLGKHQCGQEAEERIRPWLLLGFPRGRQGRAERTV